MRPAGVRERVQQLRAERERHERDHPELALRRALGRFIHECALLAFADLGADSVVETYGVVQSQLEDPSQRRTGSALERASLDCVDQLREPLSTLVADPSRALSPDELQAEAALVRIPPMTLMGRTLGAHFAMACWNAAGLLQDGVIRPYHAAARITYAGYYKPAEEPDLLPALLDLCTRYEDQPEDRAAVDVEITQMLDAWLARRRIG